MRIYFYPECNFNINKAKTYDVTSLAEWFDSQHKNPDDYEIVGRDGKSHDSAYSTDVCAVYPRIMGGKSKGKNILKVVVGLALVLATGGTTAALFSHMGGLSMAHALGAGLLLSGGGALLMGKMKMPSMDLSSDSATKENYQWNVGNLSTSRGVKGVTYGSNVIPEGELLAYRTYGTNSLKKIIDQEAGWYNKYSGAYQGKDRPVYFDGRKWQYDRYAEKRSEVSHKEITDSSSFLEVLIGAGEGELDSITDIKINDIALSDLDMVENTDYAIRLGSNTQTALKQTNLDSQAGYQSIGQTVPVKLNGSVTPLLITTPEDCDSCCIAFQTSSWYLYDTGSGAKNNAYIKLRIGYRVSGSSGAYTYVKTGIDEIDNERPFKADSAFYFQTTIKFPSNGTYQISIENDSAELNNTKGLLSAAEYSGSALPDRAAINISVDNIACYNNKEQTYPGTALIWLRIPASQTLNGSMPKITWKQTRASIYAYNGSSYVTKPADNLAWAIYDIIAQVRKDGNTYHNEGEDVANIDFDKFVSFATFCDSIGAKGNWFLNKLDTSWSNAMSVATSCRAFIGLRSGKVCPYWDAPTEMTQIFTVGNYEDMSGVITAKKDRAKAIEATFNNEEEKFASRTVRVEIDNDHSAEAVSMTFVGLSDPVNVSKQAHYFLRRNKYLVQSIKFTAGIDSIVSELNDVIGIQCDQTEYGVGGRIFKVDGNKISLSELVTLESGKTYALLVQHEDGTRERNTPIETSGTFTELTFAAGAWSTPVKKGEVFSFGISGSEVRKYRVTGITRTNDLKAQIEAIEYNENVYDELAVAPYTYTNPNAGINNVTTTYTPEAVELAWDANNNTSYVNVYVDGVFYGRYQNGAQIPNINSEQLVEMFPVNEYGEEDTPVVRTISNNLPTPSTPPVPIVQSTTTGCVAEFDGIPKDENIVWLIIKEGDNELGRANILGEYMSVSIQLRSGTHTLSAYFVNQFSKSSQARTFTATPLGDIQANDISATALKLPTGSILRLSAKNCHGAEDNTTPQTYANHISDVNGVKDVSGNGNHGRAYGDVSVIDGGEGFSFDGSTSNYTFVDITNPNLFSRINGNTGFTLSVRAKCTNINNPRIGGFICRNGSNYYLYGYFLFGNNTITFTDRLNGYNTTNPAIHTETNPLEEHTYTATVDYSVGSVVIYIDGVEANRSDNWLRGTKSGTTNFFLAYYATAAINKFSGTIKDVRVYPRPLSATEVKTMFINGEEQLFGQMTVDLLGTNIIKAENLVKTEALITTTAQIDQAVVNNLNVSGNATFTDGLTNTLNSAKADATAKVKVVTDNIYTSGTTTINGGKITTNTIKAESLSVLSKMPQGEIGYYTAKGLSNIANDASVPDISGNGNNATIMNGGIATFMDSNYGICFYKATATGKIQTPIYSVLNSNTSGFTLHIKVKLLSTSSNQVVMGVQQPSTQRVFIAVYNGYWDFGIGNTSWGGGASSGTAKAATTNWTDLTFVVDKSSKIGYLYVDGVYTFRRNYSTWTNMTLGICLGGGTGTYMSGYFTDAKIFNRMLSAEEVMALYKNSSDPEAGQITADRIATDAIKSRNFTDTNADILAGKAFATQGSFYNLAAGTLTAPKFRFGSDGSCGIGKFTIDSLGGLAGNGDEINGLIYNSFSNNKYRTQISTGYVVLTHAIKYGTANFVYGENTPSSESSSSYVIHMRHGVTGESSISSNVSNHIKGEIYGSGTFLDISCYNNSSGIKIAMPSSSSGSAINVETGNGKGINLWAAGTSSSNAGLYIAGASSSVYGLYIATAKATSSGGWSTACDESVKREIKDVSTLDKLKDLRVKKFKYSQKAIQEKAWRKEQALKAEENLKKGIKTEEEPMPEFKDDENAPDYIMAMAGEFNKAFGVDNGNEESINYTNAIGVALRAIQELAEISDAQKIEINSQKAEIAELKALLKNQQDTKSELTDHFNDLAKEPTNEDELVEPSFDELLKDEGNQQEEQKK